MVISSDSDEEGMGVIHPVCHSHYFTLKFIRINLDAKQPEVSILLVFNVLIPPIILCRYIKATFESFEQQ